jgi:hypothetical protein
MSDLSGLERPCTNCNATGVVYSARWAEWWRRHDKTWREALAANVDLPQESEEKPCRECEGKGTIPNEEGQQLLGFLKRHFHNDKG